MRTKIRLLIIDQIEEADAIALPTAWAWRVVGATSNQSGACTRFEPHLY